MKLKNTLSVLIALLSLSVLTGCLGGGSSYELSTKVAITSFRIDNNQNGFIDFNTISYKIDTIETADSTYYTITNENAFSYGALDDSLEYTFTTSNSNKITTNIIRFDTLDMPFDTFFVVSSGVDSQRIVFKDTTIRFRAFAEDPTVYKDYYVTLTQDGTNPEQINWNKQSDVLPFDQDAYMSTYAVNNKVFILWGQVDDEAGTLTNKLYSSTDGSSWAEETLTDGAYPEGIYHTIAKLENTVYCFSSVAKDDTGLYYANNKYLWKTTDGVNWSKTTDNFSSQNYVCQQAESLKGSIFVFGGTTLYGGRTKLEEALYEQDTDNSYSITPPVNSNIYKFNGSSWSTASSNYPTDMPARFASHTTGKGRIYVMNGEIAGNSEQSWDVWASENGTYWIKTASGSTEPLKGSNLVCFRNHLWRIGGVDDAGDQQITIQETEDDGASWVEVNQANYPFQAPSLWFSYRHHTQTVIDQNNLLWVIGGQQDAISGSPTQINEVWIAE